MNDHSQQHGEAGERTHEPAIMLPAPTFAPIIFAFGLTLMFAGIVTQWTVSAVGIVISFFGALAWWHSVIPHERHEDSPINPHLRPAPINVEDRSVVRLRAGEAQHRVRIPEEIHPYSAGIWGGLAGAAAMAVLACLYGLVAQHSIWYPINLLAGVVIPGIDVNQLRQFHPLWFFAAAVGHVCISILVGIVYAVILPMFPKYAPFWAGILMPIFWSGLVATILNVVNPVMNERISWPWFVVAQLGFGLVGGYVIAHSTSIKTMQNWDLAERAFVQAPGMRPEEKDQ